MQLKKKTLPNVLKQFAKTCQDLEEIIEDRRAEQIALSTRIAVLDQQYNTAYDEEVEASQVLENFENLISGGTNSEQE